MTIWQVIVLTFVTATFFPERTTTVDKMNATGETKLAVRYVINTEKSSTRFSIRHVGINRVRGAFGEVAGHVDIAPGGSSLTSVAAIQVASIETGIRRRDRHLLSDSFFAEQDFPEITFVSSAVSDIKGNQFQLAGLLKIKGIERPIVLDVRSQPAVFFTDRPPEYLEFTAEATVNRRDFEIDGGTSGRMIGNKARIELIVFAELDSLNMD